MAQSVAFAGSAIAQNAGRLEDFNSWRPGSQETKWLLMAGRVYCKEGVEYHKCLLPPKISKRVKKHYIIF